MFSFLLRIAGSYWLLCVELWEELPDAVFQSSCIILQFHQQCIKVSVSPHPCHISCSYFLTLAVLAGVKQYLIVVLICIFWWLRMSCISWSHQQTIVYFLWRNLCSDVFLIFKLGPVFIVMSYLYILDYIVPYQMYDEQDVSPILWVAFSLSLIVSSEAQNFGNIQFMHNWVRIDNGVKNCLDPKSPRHQYLGYIN